MVGLRDHPGHDLFRGLGGTSRTRRGPLSAQLDMTVRSASAFAGVDVMLLNLAWRRSENSTPDRFQQRVQQDIDSVGHNLRRDRAQSDAQIVDQVMDASRTITTMARSQEPNDATLHFVPDSSFAKSNLDANDDLDGAIRESLQIFLFALIQQFRCCEESHFLRLKLNGFHRQAQYDAQSRFFFDAYLSSREIWTRPHWVHSKCFVSDNIDMAVEAGCAMLREAELQNNDLHISLWAILDHDRKVSKNDTHTTSQEKHFKVKTDYCHTPNTAAAPIESLWTLLRGDPFLPRDKDMLCLNLALSLRRLSTEHWRRASWLSESNSEEGIFFLRDPATQEIVHKTQPYLSYRLYDGAKSEEDDHLICDPLLLDFANLIMEIHLWKGFRSIRGQRMSKEGLRTELDRRINDERVFQKRDSMFQRAVKACLDAAGKAAAQDTTNKDRLSNYIFEKIVLPLEYYAEYPNFIPSEPVTPKVVQKRTSSSPLFDWKTERIVPQDQISRAKEFFDDMKEFIKTYISNKGYTFPLPVHCRDKIRIAIIDSGLSKLDPVIRSARRKGKIQNCRNFATADPTDWDDQLSHGTIVTRQLLKVAPEAELFIAKVTSDEHAFIPKNKLYGIAKAINWAVHHWKVDIITMSLALPEKHSDIDRELDEALDPSSDKVTRKIVFAAAGNNKGGNSPRSWPACKSNIIAIHATDGLGSSVNINPNPNGEQCFATLGHGIEHRVYGTDGEDGDAQYVSGTSFATPIAAGIAANIMEYARHHVPDLNEDRKKRLYSAPCMRAIFTAMSEERGGYHYVQPWTFWAEKMRGGWWKNLELEPGDPDNVGLALKWIIANT